MLIFEQAGRPSCYDLNSGRAEIEGCYMQEGAWATSDDFLGISVGNRHERVRAINGSNLGSIYSFHAGANLAMCDGSVQFVPEGTSDEVVYAMLSREDGGTSILRRSAGATQ